MPAAMAARSRIFSSKPPRLTQKATKYGFPTPTWRSNTRRPGGPPANDLIFAETVLEGSRDDPAAIRARMEELSANREASQPIKSRTGGSTFKNPPGHKAWQLIHEARCHGP